MGVTVGGRDDDDGLAAGFFVVVLRALSQAGLLLPGGGDAAYRYDQTPDATKPALGGFCFASYLVGRGNLNWIVRRLI